MRVLFHLCNQRLLTYHTEHMWPMSEKVKKLIPTKKLIIQDSKSIEEYGWPRSNEYLLKQKNVFNQESVSRP